MNQISTETVQKTVDEMHAQIMHLTGQYRIGVLLMSEFLSNMSAIHEQYELFRNRAEFSYQWAGTIDPATGLVY